MFVSEIIDESEIVEFWDEYELVEEEQYLESPQTYKDNYIRYLSKARQKFWSKTYPCSQQYFYVHKISEQRDLIERFCSKCPDEFQCAFIAILGQETEGVWGGLETRNLRKAVKLASSLDIYTQFDDTKLETLVTLVKKTKSER